MEEWALAELQATCSNLGVFDGHLYTPDPDCVECVKDLIRFLRRDDENHCVRRALGDLRLVKSDLVHILRDHTNNRELFDVTLRLLVNLTNPELLLFKEELPEDKETRNYYLQIQSQREESKAAFVDAEMWGVMSKTLGALLTKDWDERLEDDKLIIERILILVRNLLQVPTNVRREGRTQDDASLHDQVLWVLHKSGMQDLFLFIASSDSEAHYCLHVLEIISLMFREQDPDALATANLGRSQAEKTAGEEALARARKMEEEKKKIKAKQAVSSRHSRFGGTFVLKEVKSITEKELIIQKPLQSLCHLDLDKNKRGFRKAKNKQAPADQDIVRRSTLPVRMFLKEFCVEFLLSAYNQLMGVVRDHLNRQRGQQNDETYYLWAIKFFMQFNRAHQFKLELVSDTLNRQSFHFLQQQMDNYRDNFEHEKKNRPKYLMWGRRMHLAIRAYKELLHNLVDMEGSKEDGVREAGRVLRASVFYESEYRELCLQQLSSFNSDRMSSGYLTDLVSTTHVFLKLMENMAKGNHLVVKGKKKKIPKAKGVKKSSHNPRVEVGEREQNEDRWENISSELSTILQGEGLSSLNEDVVPFDATSDEPIEDQKVGAMKKIQRHLREKKPGLAVSLLRASREVWPEGDSFGAADAEAEDEFMALREVLFADLGEDNYNVVDETSGEVGEEVEGGEEEEEEEEEVKTYSVEQQFDFKAFVFRFAVKNVVMPFGLLFSNYANNIKETNHNIIKMFHRIAVDCELPAILFQASIFRVFQQIWRDLKSNPKDQSLRELAKFAKFILAKFLSAAETNKKMFIEILFWKTSREAMEIMDGYGTQSSTAKQKASFWSEGDEEKLITIFNQVKEMSQDNEGDILDQIELMFAHEKRSRRQIGNKLRELGLIKNMQEITSKSLKSTRTWLDEETDKLKELFEQLKDADNPAARIYEQWKAANMPVRSKNKLVDRCLELELVDDRSKLGKVKKRGGRKPKEGDKGYLNRANNERDSAMEDSSSDEDGDSSEEDTEQVDKDGQTVDLKSSLTELGDEENNTLNWLGGILAEEADDRDTDDDVEDVPLVAVSEDIQLSLTKEKMMCVLRAVGLVEPSLGEQYWRIPSSLTSQQLRARAKVLEKIGKGENIETSFEGVDLSLLTVIRGLGAVVEFQGDNRKKEKRGPSKWLPFRRTDNMTEEVPITSGTVEDIPMKSGNTAKSKHKSFLDSSDDDEIFENNTENEDPENKENVEKDVVNKVTSEVLKKAKISSPKSKNISFLDSSDDDAILDNNMENEDPEKENDEKEVVIKASSEVVKKSEISSPEVVKKVTPEVVKKVSPKKISPPRKMPAKLDTSRIRRLLNDDSDLDSDSSDDNGQAEGKKRNSDTSDDGVDDSDAKLKKKTTKAKKAPAKKAPAKKAPPKKAPAKKAPAKKNAREKNKSPEVNSNKSAESDEDNKTNKSSDGGEDSTADDSNINNSKKGRKKIIKESSKGKSLGKKSSKSSDNLLDDDSNSKQLQKSIKRKNRNRTSIMTESSDDEVGDPTAPLDKPIVNDDNTEFDKLVTSTNKNDKVNNTDSSNDERVDDLQDQSDSDKEPIVKSSKKKYSIDSSDEEESPSRKTPQRTKRAKRAPTSSVKKSVTKKARLDSNSPTSLKLHLEESPLQKASVNKRFSLDSDSE